MLPPILREVPTQLLTPRLVLRVPKAGDGAAVHEAVAESIGELRAWPASLPWAIPEPSEEASETFCREAAAGFINRSFLAFLVFERETGKFIASTSLHDIEWRVPRFEVGFWCRTSMHRQGFTAEALKALLRLAFDGLGARRVDAHTDAENLASRALCESAGMRVEGVLRNYSAEPNGRLGNTCILAATDA